MNRSLWTLAVVCAVMNTGSAAYAAEADDAQQKAAGDQGQQKEEKLDQYRLSDVVVEGNRDTLANGYIDKAGKVGLLGEKDVMHTPFQVTTLDKKAIEQFSIPGRTLLDVLSLSPSVRANDGVQDSSVSIRGFSSNGNKWFLNGVPGMTHQKDMPINFADKISVISGPALGVRGTACSWQENAGGMVNLISKQGEDKKNTDMKFTFSGKSYFTQAVDYGERFGENKRWGIRINAMQGQGTLSVDNCRMWKWNFFVNIDQKTENSKTNLLLGYDYTKQRGDGNGMSLGKAVTRLPSAPEGTVNFSPAWAEDEYSDWVAVLNHEQRLGRHLQAFLDAGYHRENYTSWIQPYYGRVMINNAGDYTAALSQWPVVHTTKYLGIGLKGDFSFGGWNNDYVLSVDRNWFKREKLMHGNSHTFAANGNIYSTNGTEEPGNFYLQDVGVQYTTRMTGWHVVDTITSPNQKLGITLGLHGHRGVTQYHDGSAEVDANATCPTYALTYQFTPAFMAYANHSESFSEGSVVAAGYANAGDVIPPAKTKQNEIGFKYQQKGFLHTLSFFEIKQQNGFAAVEGTKKYYRLDGEQRNRGIEYSAVGRLAPKWDMIFAASYLDAKQTKTKNGTNDGLRVNGVPEWSSTLALVYKPTERFSVIGRLNYTGNTTIRQDNTAGAANSIGIPAITTFDLGFNYKTRISGNDVTFGLMCKNVFDHNYWYASGNSIYLGMPRTFMLSASCSL